MLSASYFRRYSVLQAFYKEEINPHSDGVFPSGFLANQAVSAEEISVEFIMIKEYDER